MDRQTGIFTVSLAIYYTPAFNSITSNVQAFFANQVASANAALINTHIQMRLSIHCIQLIDLREQSSGTAMLSVFKSAKGKLHTVYKNPQRLEI